MSITFSAPEETGAQFAGDFMRALLQKGWGVAGLRQEGFQILPASPLQCWLVELHFKTLKMWKTAAVNPLINHRETGLERFTKACLIFSAASRQVVPLYHL